MQQTYRNFEVIFCDDGSTDHTLEIAQKYTSDPRVTVLSNPAPKGVSATLNQAIKKARGELIARMDADDLMKPERLATQTAFLKKHPHLGVLASTAIPFTTTPNPLGKQFRCPKSHNAILRRFLFKNPIVHPTVMFNRKVVGQLLHYDEGVKASEDYLLWAELLHKVEFHILPKPLLYYRTNPTSNHAHPDRIETDAVARRRFLARYGIEDRRIVHIFTKCSWGQLLSAEDVLLLRDLCRANPGVTKQLFGKLDAFCQFTSTYQEFVNSYTFCPSL